MQRHLKPKFIYIAFDVFPSQKGAATHIDHCLKALERTFSSGLLICLGTETMPHFQFDAERNLYVYRWKEKIANFLERTQKFQAAISRILKLPIASEVELIHFRDVWGGIPVLQNKPHTKTVFEVNSFSYLELPVRYPNMNPAVITKIKKLELECILKSTAIITPSSVTRDYILAVSQTNKIKVTIISNGVKVLKTKELEKINTRYILYFGAFQKWQGIKTLFKAFKELVDTDLRLMLCASIPEKRLKSYQELAKSLGINSRIDWYFELDKIELAQKITEALVTVAPLTACDRNITQGCNPLKIVESMGYGTPVVASKLPVTEVLIKDGETGFLVPPDRPEVLGRRIRSIIEQVAYLEEVGDQAKKMIKDLYLWEYQESKMIKLYQSLE